MKIALALSGLPRIFPISAASWGRIVGKYQPDIYIHSWSQSPEIDAVTQHQLQWMFNPISIRIDPLPDIDTSSYPDRHWPCIDVYRSLSMWSSIKHAHEMVLNSDKSYDLIIRGRLDWYVENLNICEFNGIVLPYDADKHVLKFNYQDIDVYGYNDHFSYGPIEYMNQYVKTADLIYHLYSHEQIDYCPENFLRASLMYQGCPVLLQQFFHKLIRS